MMRAKADPKAITPILYGLSVLLLVGALGVHLFVKPKPPSAAVEKTQANKLRKQIQDAQMSSIAAKASVISRTWSEAPAAVQDKVLTLTATLAKKRGVSFVRLQPQRVSADSGPLDQLPFLLVIEGPFPAVTSLEKDLELPANRLAVSQFQITSSDSESDKVSASIGLVAHRIPVVVETTKETPKTNGKRA